MLVYIRPSPREWEGLSGGAKVLGKLSVPGRPTNLDKSRTTVYCGCNRVGLFGHFFLSSIFFLSFSLSGTRPNME